MAGKYFNKGEKVKYYRINEREWKLEKISAFLYYLTIFENGKKIDTRYFEGEQAYLGAMAEILSYAEIAVKT